MTNQIDSCSSTLNMHVFLSNFCPKRNLTDVCRLPMVTIVSIYQYNSTLGMFTGASVSAELTAECCQQFTSLYFHAGADLPCVQDLLRHTHLYCQKIRFRMMEKALAKGYLYILEVLSQAGMTKWYHSCLKYDIFTARPDPSNHKLLCGSLHASKKRGATDDNFSALKPISRVTQSPKHRVPMSLKPGTLWGHQLQW